MAIFNLMEMSFNGRSGDQIIIACAEIVLVWLVSRDI